jgi:hypothetical protein
MMMMMMLTVGLVVLLLQRDTSANMSDHTTSGTRIQELVLFALALKLMLHEPSMSLTASALVPAV